MRIDLSNLSSLVDNYYRQNPEAAASSGYTPVAPPVAAPRPIAPPVVAPAPVAPPVVAPAPVVPKPAPVEYTSLNNPFLDYRDTLSGGANYADINDVDNVDDYYDTAFEKAFSDTGYLTDIDIIGGEGGVGGGQVDYSPTRILSEQEYRGFVGDAPAYLSDFKKDATLKQALTAVGSLKDLTSTEDIQAALSSYYGYDVTASEQSFSKSDFGGNLGEHTNSSDSQLQQFHSLVEPILKDQISYLQATEGLSYQDALSVSYNRDPMLQALYAKYDVKPYRQTKDGSTYLYDPFSFSEIRTNEVKDPSFTDIAVNLAKTALVAAVLGPIAGSIFKGSTVAANLATAGATAMATGGDPLQAMLLAGIPIGDIPIPFTGGRSNDIVTSSNTSSATLNSLTGNLVNWTAGSNPLLTAISTAGIAGGLQPTGSSSTGATPDFNPYINNIAAVAGGTTVEAEEENLNIDLANLAALSQQEEAPVTPVTPPPLATEPVAVPVEPIEQPELPLDVAPPVLPTEDTSDGSTPSDSSEDSAVSDPSETITTGSTPVDEQEEKDGPFFRITKRNNDGSVEAIDIFGNISIFSSDQLGTKPDGTPILAGETYSDETASGADADIIVGDIFGDTTTNVETTDPVETVGSVESPEVTSEIGTVTDATTTGDAATGDSGSGSGTGDGTGDGSGGGTGGGLGAGMLGGAAAGGKPSVTDLVFSDYVKRYEAPELQKRVLPLQGYQAPQGLFRGLV